MVGRGSWPGEDRCSNLFSSAIGLALVISWTVLGHPKYSSTLLLASGERIPDANESSRRINPKFRCVSFAISEVT